MRDFTTDHSALALNTATLGHNLDGHGAGWSTEAVIDACAERGFGGIAFWRREIRDPIRMGERVRAAGMQVIGLCRTPFLVGPLAPPSRQAVIDDFKSAIDLAAGLGAAVLTVVVGGVAVGTRSLQDSLDQVCDIMGEMAPIAAAAGVKLGLEPLHPVYGGNRSCLMSVRDAVDMCEAINHPAVGVAIDVYHVWWDLTLAAELKRAGSERIFGFHLCDWLADTTDVLLDRGMMGDGVADLRRLRSAVEDAGYRGLCEVEIFSANDWWQRDPGDVLDVCVRRFREVC